MENYVSKLVRLRKVYCSRIAEQKWTMKEQCVSRVYAVTLMLGKKEG